jgi:hypothetical protein
VLHIYLHATVAARRGGEEKRRGKQIKICEYIKVLLMLGKRKKKRKRRDKKL